MRMLQTFDIKRVAVDGIDVAYCVVGEGEKLAVMCQGWGTNFKLYKLVADSIGDKYRTVLFDFPGFGMTAEPPEPWDVPQYTEFFAHFLSTVPELNATVPEPDEGSSAEDGATVPERCPEPVEGPVEGSSREITLIGHSFGGRVIIEFASTHNVGKIVLIDSAGVMPQHDSSHNWRVKTYKLGKKILTNKFVHSLFPEVIDDWMSRQGSADYRAASPLMKQVLVKAVNYDQQHLMGEISAPTLLIWGDQDDATPISDAHIMEQKFQDAGLVVIPGAGHFSFAENPALFTSAIRAFLCTSTVPEPVEGSLTEANEATVGSSVRHSEQSEEF